MIVLKSFECFLSEAKFTPKFDIEEYFDKMNSEVWEKYFDTKIPKPDSFHWKAHKQRAAWVVPKGKNHEFESMNFSKNINYDEQLFVNVLLHEMTHIYLEIKKMYQDRTGHGSAFTRTVQEIFNKTNGLYKPNDKCVNVNDLKPHENNNTYYFVYLNKKDKVSGIFFTEKSFESSKEDILKLMGALRKNYPNETVGVLKTTSSYPSLYKINRKVSKNVLFYIIGEEHKKDIWEHGEEIDLK